MGNKTICSSTFNERAANKSEKRNTDASNKSSGSHITSPTSSTPCYLVQSDDWPYVWAIRDVSILDKIWKHSLTEKQIYEIERNQHDLPIHVFNNIYLGNAASTCVQDLNKLESLGIKRVLNMAGPYAVKKSLIKRMKQRGIVYRCIDAHDEEGYPLLKRHWNEAHEFIHSNHSNMGIESCCHPHTIFGGCLGIGDDTTINDVADDNRERVNDNGNASDNNNILIHCVAGQNRSVLIVAIEYMLSKQCNVLETMLYIRKIRGHHALNNESFQEQLVSIAKQNNLLGPLPGPNTGCIVEKSAPPPSWRSNFHETFSSSHSSSSSSHSYNDEAHSNKLSDSNKEKANDHDEEEKKEAIDD